MSTDNIVCPACGTEMPANALLCPKCGRANISSAFAAPSTTQSPERPNSTDTTPSIFENTGSSTASGTNTYSSTDIPKTVLPWETSSPGDVGQSGANTVDLTNRILPTEANENDRGELLQRTVKTLDELRQAEIVEENERRQRVVQTIDELRQMKASDGQYPATMAQPPVLHGSPPAYYPPQDRGQWAGSMVSKNPSAQSPNQGQRTLRRVTYQPTSQEYYSPSQSGQPQPRPAVRSGVNPKTAVNLEYLGFIGLLGIGHIYAGYLTRGIVLFIGWLVVTQLLVQSVIRGQGWCLVIPALLVPGLSYRWLAWSLRRSA